MLRPLLGVALLAGVWATNRSDGDYMPNGLPGTTFVVNYKQFAGYLNYNTPSTSGQLHYWHIMSQTNGSSDPLIVFLNGGPGCSSVFGMMEEIGPFRVNADGQTLYENVFSWNKMAHLLVIDAPGVGFSPVTNNKLDDTSTSNALEDALNDFFNVFPGMINNPVFLAGEGYGAVFATLVGIKIQSRATTPKANLAGLAIGNGLLDSTTQFNSLMAFSYMHGFAGKDEWDDLRSSCCVNQSTLTCDYVNSPSADCQTKSKKAASTWIGNLNDPFNVYQDCYTNQIRLQNSASVMGLQLAAITNSTDPLNGFPCNADVVTRMYLDQKAVRTALHVSDKAASEFNSCINLNYGDKSTSITVNLANFVNDKSYTAKGMKVILYNGDLDSTSTFIGAQQFGVAFAKTQNYTLTSDAHWQASYNGTAYKEMEGGLVRSYSSNFTVLSIRGAGHFAPLDKPAQTLQVIRNFVLNLKWDNCLKYVNLKAQDLLPQYQFLQVSQQRKAADLITDLPGLSFQIFFKQYSGYLSGSDKHKLHYWLVESQRDPANDPILLWLNGRPGSSSIWGMLTENGPFRPNKDGNTLYENVYSWNKFANVLYLEAPYGVGFSYTTVANESNWNDDLTADDNYNAIKDFLNVFPEYKTRPFFVTGESYGGVYIPTLSRRLINGIFTEDIQLNFQGIAIGNAELTTKYQVNSVIFQLYAYGILGQTEYDALTSRCCNQTDTTTCDFYTPYINFDNHGKYVPLPGADQWCATTVISYVYDMVWKTQNDAYNPYQDCYNYPSAAAVGPTGMSSQSFVDQKTVLNTGTTDPFNGFPCWGDDASVIYMNLPSVRQALHIPDSVGPWQTFNKDMNENFYNRQYFELDGELAFIINNYIYDKNNMRMMIYNGDADLVCNHLGDQWFFENFAANNNLTTVAPRGHWHYMLTQNTLQALAGYIKKFSKNISMVTVKGSGHLVPMDRPGPALQMIYNFVNNLDMSTVLNINLEPAQMKPDYQGLSSCSPLAAAPFASLAPITTPFPINSKALLEDVEEDAQFDVSNLTAQAQADMITSLPGLTFHITFRQFSGYLRPAEYPTDQLFYWFTESQNDPVNDPVLLWLNGGPGCSSLLGFFNELGPFHPNDDGGQTLYENVYTWNKKANVLYMEAPAEVGFSSTSNKNYTWNDDTTAVRNAYAIKYFFEQVFPEYASHEFYVSGESYGGVYVPTLTLQLIQLIQGGKLTLNFKGFAIGNGILSEYLQNDSEQALQYGRGLNGLDDWNNLKSGCGLNNTNPIYFSYPFDDDGSSCANALFSYQDMFYGDEDDNVDLYNIYQDCYAYSAGSSSAKKSAKRTMKPRSRMEKTIAARKTRGRKSVLASTPFVNNDVASWYGSTDPFHGFPCYNDDATTNYLNRKDVQAAIHAQLKPGKQWEECFDRENYPYHDTPDYYNMTETFNRIMDSKWYSSNNMRIMLYNGDLDTICQFLGDQWFVENLVVQRNMTVSSPRQPWFYQMGQGYPQIIAGYAKSWNQKNLVQLTVKGAGHMVPMDRPAIALQMINNFLANSPDYSLPQTVDLTPKPLLKQFQDQSPPVGNCSRKDSDRVLGLPGAPKDLPFKQYSGFLKASPTHFLHYWLIESETDPASAPLLLWLNGGPGSSSMDGLFQEHGPYRLNKDGTTFSLNQYAWNKFANVLFLESPVGVGYSYTTDGITPAWNDDNTAIENYAALQDFFVNVMPEYQTRAFYLTGESYAGVYLPMLTEKLINGIQNGTFVINFKGTALGNGVVDKAILFNTIVHTEYYRAGITYSDYQQINQLCCQGVPDELNCMYSDRITDFNPIVYSGNQSDPCYQKLNSTGIYVEAGVYDPYNLYQQCYRLLNDGQQGVDVGESWTGINYESSDANGGYWCYMDNALVKYLNLPTVRRALNIPDSNGPWDPNNNIFFAYQQQVNSTDAIYQRILTSPYYKAGNFQLLIYSGDADQMCNWLSSEWFTNKVMKNSLGLPITSTRKPWTFQTGNKYQPTQGGYAKRYATNVDVLTVKGAGHFVPLDRPQQAQQMIYNWITGNDYSTPFNGSPVPPPSTTVTTPTPSNSTTIITTTTPQSNTTTTTTTVPPKTTTMSSMTMSVFSALIAFITVYFL